MKRIGSNFGKDTQGHILLEAVIALAVVGAVTFLIVHNDIMPGLSVKWERMNNTIQNNWLE
ncbi:MAG: hypothetical protein RBT41_10350 [Clostridia bacterium]|jgi:Flp pilus assembly pilin Flp|nr:hypothetical protein [Clostridia bacterium]